MGLSCTWVSDSGTARVPSEKGQNSNLFSSPENQTRSFLFSAFWDCKLKDTSFFLPLFK